MSKTDINVTVSDSSKGTTPVPADDLTDSDSGITSQASDNSMEECLKSGTDTDINLTAVDKSPVECSENTSNPGDISTHPPEMGTSQNEEGVKPTLPATEEDSEIKSNANEMSTPAPEQQTTLQNEEEVETEPSSTESKPDAVSTPPPEQQTAQCEDEQGTNVQSTGSQDEMSTRPPQELQTPQSEEEVETKTLSTESSEDIRSSEVVATPQPAELQTPQVEEETETKPPSSEGPESTSNAADKSTPSQELQTSDCEEEGETKPQSSDSFENTSNADEMSTPPSEQQTPLCEEETEKRMLEPIEGYEHTNNAGEISTSTALHPPEGREEEGTALSPQEKAPCSNTPSANSQASEVEETVAQCNTTTEEAEKSQVECSEIKSNSGEISTPPSELQTSQSEEEVEAKPPPAESNESITSSKELSTPPQESQTPQCEEPPSSKSSENISNTDEISTLPQELQTPQCEEAETKPKSTKNSENTHNADGISTAPELQTPHGGDEDSPQENAPCSSTPTADSQASEVVLSTETVAQCNTTVGEVEKSPVECSENTSKPEEIPTPPPALQTSQSEEKVEETNPPSTEISENTKDSNEESTPPAEAQAPECEEKTTQPSSDSSKINSNAEQTSTPPPEQQTSHYKKEVETKPQSTESSKHTSNQDEISAHPQELQAPHCEEEAEIKPPSTVNSDNSKPNETSVSSPELQTPQRDDGEVETKSPSTGGSENVSNLDEMSTSPEGTRTKPDSFVNTINTVEMASPPDVKTPNAGEGVEDCESEHVNSTVVPDGSRSYQQSTSDHHEAEPTKTAHLNPPESCGNVNSMAVPVPDIPRDSSSCPLGFRTDVSVHVAGVDMKVEPEILELYFQHPRLSGGGATLNFLDRRSDGYVIIFFRDPEVVHRILDGRCHCVPDTKRQLKVSRSNVLFPSPGTAAVLVQGGVVVTKRLALQLYFTNPDHGGGQIKDIQVDSDLLIAWIAFVEAKVAAEIAKRSHTLYGTSLAVTSVMTEGIGGLNLTSAGGADDVRAGSAPHISLEVPSVMTENSLDVTGGPKVELRSHVNVIPGTTTAVFQKAEAPRRLPAAPEQHLAAPPSVRPQLLSQTTMMRSETESQLSLVNPSSNNSSCDESDSQRAPSPEYRDTETEDEHTSQCFIVNCRLSSSSEQENYGNRPEATVAVHGLKRNTSKCAVHNYFDNPRQSRGGEVIFVSFSSAAEGTAFVTFRHARDAKNVKDHKCHKLDDETLDVTGVVMNQVLIGNLPRCFNEELRNFVVAKTCRTVEGIKFGRDGNVAIVTFTKNIDPRKVQGILESNSLQEKTLHVEPVPLTNKALVRDLPTASASMSSMQIKELLSNMFVSRLDSPMDPKIEVADSKDYAIVIFAKPCDASDVANSEEPYTFHNRKLSISLYNESLGPSGGVLEQPLTKPQPLHVKDCATVLKIFLMAKHCAMMSRLKEKLDQYHAQFHNSTNFDVEPDGHEIQIICTLTERVEGANYLAASWPETVLKILNNYLDTHFYQKTAPYNMAAYCSAKAQRVTEDVKDSLCVFCDSVNETVHVFCDCQKSRGSVDGIIAEALAENKKLTETRIPLNVEIPKGKLRLLKAHNVGKDTQDKFPNLIVEFNLSAGSVELTGSDIEVGLMLLTIQKSCQFVFTDSHSWNSPAVSSILSSPEAQNFVENVCKGTDPDGEVDFSDYGFQTHSFDKEKAEQMVKSGKNTVTEKVIILEDESLKAAVKTGEWESLRDSAVEKCEGMLRIVENESSVTMVAVGTSAADQFSVIEKFIYARRTVEKLVSLKMPLPLLLQTTLRSKYKDDAFRVDECWVERHGLDVAIKGNEAGVDALTKFIRELENEASDQASFAESSESSKGKEQ